MRAFGVMCAEALDYTDGLAPSGGGWQHSAAMIAHRLTDASNRVTSRTIAAFVLGLALGASFGPAQAQASARRLIQIMVPQHDPLFLDAASMRRNGTRVSFKYVLDVLAPKDEDSKPSIWKSNEIEATIDCRSRTVSVRKLTAYSGPRASGTATAVHTFTAPGIKPEPIAPNSTFAYLETHVCRGG